MSEFLNNLQRRVWDYEIIEERKYLDFIEGERLAINRLMVDPDRDTPPKEVLQEAATWLAQRSVFGAHKEKHPHG